MPFSGQGVKAMAGLLKTFVYSANTGTDYLYRADSTNGDAVANGVPDPATTLENLPKDFLPRYALLEAVNPIANKAPLQRKVPIGSVESAIWKGTTKTAALQVVGSAGTIVFQVSALVDERRVRRKIL